MTAIIPQIAGGANRCAFLDLIAHSEHGSMLKLSNDGYDVLFGSSPKQMFLFKDCRTHPNIVREVTIEGRKTASSAAGRYQLLYRYWAPYTKLLGLTDFGPETQDRIALQQIKECHALPLIDAGDVVGAVKACAHIWASLPGASYGQHENKIADLVAAYVAAGGALALDHVEGA